MVDVEFLRNEPDKVRAMLKRRNADAVIFDDFLRIDREWRDLTNETDGLRKTQKDLSSKKDIESAKENKKKIKEKESELVLVEKKRNELLLSIPNIPFDDVPDGINESQNKIIRTFGAIAEFNFKPKDHVEIAENLDIIDFNAGAKTSGSGFYYLKNEGVILELSLVRYALDFLKKKGFSLWLTPDVARDTFYLGTGYLPQGDEAQTYVIENSDLGLIATAEVTLAAIHAGEALSKDDLPKFYAGYSHCFRQESGSYGKYSRGLYRVHQFTKVEMFAYTTGEQSEEVHQKILSFEEELWQGLGVPYRVVEMCVGDLGAQAARKYDLEAWMPGRGNWGEVTSASNTTDFQARRLNIKYKTEDGKSAFAHTLNGTAIAVSRAIISILENFQQEDGSVVIPKVLVPYTGFEKITNGRQ